MTKTIQEKITLKYQAKFEAMFAELKTEATAAGIKIRDVTFMAGVRVAEQIQDDKTTNHTVFVSNEPTFTEAYSMVNDALATRLAILLDRHGSQEQAERAFLFMVPEPQLLAEVAKDCGDISKMYNRLAKATLLLRMLGAEKFDDFYDKIKGKEDVDAMVEEALKKAANH